jgi:hypothetical protein
MGRGEEQDWLFNHKKLMVTKVCNFKYKKIPPVMKYLILTSSLRLCAYSGFKKVQCLLYNYQVITICSSISRLHFEKHSL